MLLDAWWNLLLLFAICVSFERMMIWIFGALSLTSIGVGKPLLKVGTSLELLGKVWKRKASLVASFKTSRYDFAIRRDRSGPKRDRLGKVEFQIFFHRCKLGDRSGPKKNRSVFCWKIFFKLLDKNQSIGSLKGSIGSTKNSIFWVLNIPKLLGFG